MTIQNTHQFPLTLLCEERTQVAALTIVYHLYHRADGIYLMEISDGADVRRASLGARLRPAASFFFAVVDGGVTPCTFFDVLEDADDEGFFQKIPLQSGKNML